MGAIRRVGARTVGERDARGGSAGGGGRGLHAIGRHARKARACEGRLRGWTRACGGSGVTRVRACGGSAAARLGARVWRACVSCAAERLSTAGSAGRGRARTTGGPRRGQGEGGRVRTVGGGGDGGEWRQRCAGGGEGGERRQRQAEVQAGRQTDVYMQAAAHVDARAGQRVYQLRSAIGDSSSSRGKRFRRLPAAARPDPWRVIALPLESRGDICAAISHFVFAAPQWSATFAVLT